MRSGEIAELLEVLSPKHFAMSWDNVGFLVGDTKKEVSTILVALDFTNDTVEKAIEINADMIVTHHPIIFGGMKNITNETVNGNRILKLLSNNICGYSMHTNFDVKGGMAELAGSMLCLENTVPLEVTSKEGSLEGIGRVGTPSEIMTVEQWCNKVKDVFGINSVLLYGDKTALVEKVAVSPGSGKDFVELAKDAGANLLITGDINHHAGIDAVDMSINIIDSGHYGTEYIFVDYIVNYLCTVCPEDVKVIGMEKKIPFAII